MVDEKENTTLAVNEIINISPILSKIDKSSTVYAEDDNCNNVLICSKFQEALQLDFGKVAPRSIKQLKFYLRNPSKFKSVKVAVDRYNEKSGISISLDGIDGKVVSIDAESQREGSIYWMPSTDCMMRVVIGLKMDDRAPLQIIVRGTAGTGIVILNNIFT